MFILLLIFCIFNDWSSKYSYINHLKFIRFATHLPKIKQRNISLNDRIFKKILLIWMRYKNSILPAIAYIAWVPWDHPFLIILNFWMSYSSLNNENMIALLRSVNISLQFKIFFFSQILLRFKNEFIFFQLINFIEMYFFRFIILLIVLIALELWFYS